MKHNFEYYWEQIEENFEWNKVYQVMKLLDWTWGLDADASIPSVDMLKSEARRLCYYAHEEQTNISTGGFYAQAYEDGISLSFVLENWGAEDYE